MAKKKVEEETNNEEKVEEKKSTNTKSSKNKNSKKNDNTTSQEQEKDRASKLELAKKAITKKYGNIIGIMGEERELFIPTISSGSLGLDLALGRGGFARG